jgi:hypothetical protein
MDDDLATPAAEELGSLEHRRACGGGLTPRACVGAEQTCLRLGEVDAR